MDNNNSIELKINRWLTDLQKERKCNNTNSIVKAVGRAPEEVQIRIPSLISTQLTELIRVAQKTQDVTSLKAVCRVINGCFDNFKCAVLAIRQSYQEVLRFISACIDVCRETLTGNNGIENTNLTKVSDIMDLLHCVSRILVLVLKLSKTEEDRAGGFLTSDVKLILQGMSHSSSIFFLIDNISMDVKHNLAMSSLLIKEITMTEAELIDFHAKFLMSIPCKIEDAHYKLNIVKYIMSNAIINMSSSKAVDGSSFPVYLQFLLNLCEKYSSNTSLTLNTSRSLSILTKHSAALQEYVLSPMLDPPPDQLVGCIWMLLEHPIPCVRHSGKDLLQNVATHTVMHPLLVDHVMRLERVKRSFYFGLGVLASTMGSREILQYDNSLADYLFLSLSDPNLSSHAAFALECLISCDGLLLSDPPLWVDTWVVRLLLFLEDTPVVAANIEKLLRKIFKDHPWVASFVVDKWDPPYSSLRLRWIVTLYKIGHQVNSFKADRYLGKGAYLDAEKRTSVISACSYHADDTIRLTAFSLLVNTSTRLHVNMLHVNREAIRGMVQDHFQYNVNNDRPATRQRFIGIVRELLAKLSEWNTLDKDDELFPNTFLTWLWNFCFDNIFPGANFNRLNTVLCILTRMEEEMVKWYCLGKHNLQPSTYNKLYIVIQSSYEENMVLAVKLAKILRPLNFAIEEPGVLVSKGERMLKQISSMEPPYVLTGTYGLQAFTSEPGAVEALQTIAGNKEISDVNLLCVIALADRLQVQVDAAKSDLVSASLSNPMYGAMFAARLIINSVNLPWSSTYKSTGGREEDVVRRMWYSTLLRLLTISFEMTEVVSHVVNNSSPEGHLPMDFQTNFDNMLPGLTSASSNGPDVASHAVAAAAAAFDEESCLLGTISDDEFLKGLPARVKALFLFAMRAKDNFESLLLQSQALLMEMEKRKVLESSEVTGEVKRLLEVIAYLKSLMPRTKPNAQILLLCSWRTMKEACLYLGDLVSSIPLGPQAGPYILEDRMVSEIADRLCGLLCEIKHRGAFEQAYIGFSQLCLALYRCPTPQLQAIPRSFLKTTLDQLRCDSANPKMKLCWTRRSAGLPFLIQAIVTTEMQVTKSLERTMFHETMTSLLELAESKNMLESRIHSLNILRALFKHNELGELVSTYISRAFMVAIRGSRAATWPERNSSSLLFSALITRVFGVSRTRDELSKKNRMTTRTFFQRYHELYDFMLSEMEMAHREEDSGRDGIAPQPSLYLILLILGRLYPSFSQEGDSINLTPFRRHVNKCTGSRTMKMRQLAARALLPLLGQDAIVEELDNTWSLLGDTTPMSHNLRHGLVLQVETLLKEWTIGRDQCQRWLEHTKWILEMREERQKMSFIIIASYIRVLHHLLVYEPDARDLVPAIVLNTEVCKKTDMLMDSLDKSAPGGFVMLETFMYLKVDVLISAEDFDWTKLIELFRSLLTCQLRELSVIPLKLLACCLEHKKYPSREDNHMLGCGVSVEDLHGVRDIEKCDRLVSVVKQESENLRNMIMDVVPQMEAVWGPTCKRLCLAVLNLLMDDLCDDRIRNRSPWIFPFKRIEHDARFMDAAVEYLAWQRLFDNSLLRHRKKMEMLLKDVVSDNLAKVRIIRSLYLPYAPNGFEPHLGHILLLVVDLLADDEAAVRQAASNLVAEVYVGHPGADPEREAYDGQVVPYRAQKVLLKCYVLKEGHTCPEHMSVPLVMRALSACVFPMQFVGVDNDCGVFEKGNPNPFGETLATTDLYCDVFKELLKIYPQTSFSGFADRSIFEDSNLEIFDNDSFNPCIYGLVDCITAEVENWNNPIAIQQILRVRQALRLELTPRLIQYQNATDK